MVERNVILADHYHGVSLYDAQDCLIRENACFSRWGGASKPWVMLGVKRNFSLHNTVVDNLAHNFLLSADPEVIASNNFTVTEATFQDRFSELADLIDRQFGNWHEAAGRFRLQP